MVKYLNLAFSVLTSAFCVPMLVLLVSKGSIGGSLALGLLSAGSLSLLVYDVIKLVKRQ